jgi:hypothetical protein
MNRRLILLLAVVALFVLALAPAALGHPSENRAVQSTFGGPHCHTNLISGELAFPSHQAHLRTGDAGLAVFAPAACPAD